MKRLATAILALCCVFMLRCALADADRFCDEMPRAVLEMEQRDNPDREYSDCIIIKGTPVGDVCIVLTPWNMHGYFLKDGVWTNRMQVSPIYKYNAPALYFRRHEAGAAPGAQGKAGLSYEDGLGFDIIRGVSGEPDNSDIMQFHWRGDDFELVGWQRSDGSEFAILKGDKWAYFDKHTGEALGEAYIDYLQKYGIMVDFDDLPATLDEAMNMQAVTRQSAESCFPGWTLSSYSEYNGGHMAGAGYYRIDDGVLTVRRASLESEAGGVSDYSDTMPVPLSARLIERLRTEPFETLVDTRGDGDTFLTDDAFDTAVIPVTDKVLFNDLQTNGLMLMTEDAGGARRLCWVEKRAEGYTVRTTKPLPQGTSLDLFHCGDDAVSLEWDEQYKQCLFSRNADGSWSLGWYTNHKRDEDDEMYGTLYCGIQQYGVMNGSSGILVGSHSWGDMFAVDFAKLPSTVKEAAAALDRDGWAVVNNPDPADRLHLRVKPDRSAKSLGKFYNRTPVRVLGTKGDWSHVIIGADGRLEGWMLTKYLAFGDKMDAVEDASPQKVLIDEYKYKQLYASLDMTDTTGDLVEYGFWIIGAVDDELYVLLNAQGYTGYMPQSWFFDGNG